MSNLASIYLHLMFFTAGDAIVLTQKKCSLEFARKIDHEHINLNTTYGFNLDCEVLHNVACPIEGVTIDWYKNESFLTNSRKMGSDFVVRVELQKDENRHHYQYQCVIRSDNDIISRKFDLRITNTFLWTPIAEKQEKKMKTIHHHFGQTARFHSQFYIRSDSLRPQVKWYFSPGAFPSVQPVQLWNRKPGNHMASRYDITFNRIPCGVWPASGICFQTTLTLFDLKADDSGLYTCQIKPESDVKTPDRTVNDKGLECQFKLTTGPDPFESFYDLNGNDEQFEQYPIDTHPHQKLLRDDTLNDVSVTLLTPPFVIQFNMNSTICVGDNFTLHCAIDPVEVPADLYLIQVDPRVDLGSEDPTQILDLLNSTILQSSENYMRNPTEDASVLRHDLYQVTRADDGRFMCFGGQTGVPMKRWRSMYLHVRECSRELDLGKLAWLSRILRSPGYLTLACCLTFLLSVGMIFCVLRQRHVHHKLSPIAAQIPQQPTKKRVHVFRHPNQLYPVQSPLSNGVDLSKYHAASNQRCSDPVGNFEVCLSEGYQSQTDSTDVYENPSSGIHSRRQASNRPVPQLSRLSVGQVRKNHNNRSNSNSSTNTSGHGSLPLSDQLSYSANPSDCSNSNPTGFPWPTTTQGVHENGTVTTDESQVNALRVQCEPTTVEYELPLDEEWELPRNCLQMGRKLGEGAFGVVFFGSISLNGLAQRHVERLLRPSTSSQKSEKTCLLAVKMLRADFTEQEIMDLVRETEVMKLLGNHPHLIKLYGTCTQSGPLQVLVEYAPHGNLRDFLRSRRCPQTNEEAAKMARLPRPYLSRQDLLNFGLQVARGMDYLASKSVVHRDLAARNVLIGDAFVVKIADFGLTRSVSDYYRKRSNGRLPIKWMSPESIFDRKYTTKSDVWSFGVLLWEIFTLGGVPYPSISHDRLLVVLPTGYRNTRPALANDTVYELMLNCWSEAPHSRPDFTRIVHWLVQVRRTPSNWLSDEPINAFRFGVQSASGMLPPIGSANGITPTDLSGTSNSTGYVDMGECYLNPRQNIQLHS